MKKVADIKIDKLEDRKTVAGILLENGYTISPMKKQQEGKKAYQYGIAIYKDEVQTNGD